MIRVVQLGSPRLPDEGLRIGTVRRPPRGVPRSEYARRDYYDVWLPDLAPSADLVSGLKAHEITPAAWSRFARRYRAELRQPAARRLLDLLAALSQTANFSIGCYCADESLCHRSLLREVLVEAGAAVR